MLHPHLVLPRPGTLHTFATGLARGGRKYFRLCTALSVLCMEFIWANLQIIAFRARPETGTWTSITTPIYIWQLPCWHLFNGLRPSYPTPTYPTALTQCSSSRFCTLVFFMAFEWISPRQRTNWRHALRLCQDDNVKDFTRFGQRQRKFRVGFFSLQLGVRTGVWKSIRLFLGFAYP